MNSLTASHLAQEFFELAEVDAFLVRFYNLMRGISNFFLQEEGGLIRGHAVTVSVLLSVSAKEILDAPKSGFILLSVSAKELLELPSSLCACGL